MINKKDWVVAKDQFEKLTKAQEDTIVNCELNMELYKYILPFIEEKLKAFPEDKVDDPMPKEVKELVEEIK